MGITPSDSLDYSKLRTVLSTGFCLPGRGFIDCSKPNTRWSQWLHASAENASALGLAGGLSISTQVCVTDWADAILLLHQEADPEERKAEEDHQDEDQPALR
jgi:hypothetical protein